MIKANPVILPRSLCVYSQKKINLNPLRSMAGLSLINSGNCLYFSKAISQSCCVSGGIAPDIRFHSTIDNPEPVSLVIPPIITIRNTSKQPDRDTPLFHYTFTVLYFSLYNSPSLSSQATSMLLLSTASRIGCMVSDASSDRAKAALPEEATFLRNTLL